MAKVAAKPMPKAKGKEVMTRPGKQVAKSNVDVSLLREQDAGIGVSTDAADNIVPLIYVLQAQSPVCLKQKPEYIKGAEAGMLWPRGTKDLWDGDEGVRVVPCHFSNPWLEWKPERAGFVARHASRPAVAEQVQNPQDPETTIWQMPSGNILQEAREYACLILDVGTAPRPGVFSFTGSNHAAARGWMTGINGKQTAKGNKASLFEFVWQLKTVAKSNDKGDWYGLAVEDLEERTPDDVYLLARNVAQQFGTGELKAAAPTEEDSEGGDAGDTDVM